MKSTTLLCLLSLLLAGARPLAAESLDSISPGSLGLGESGTFTLTGTDTTFSDASTVSVQGTGVTVSGVTFVSPTVLTVDIMVSPVAGSGFRDVTVTTGTDTVTGLQLLRVDELLYVPRREVAAILLRGSTVSAATVGYLSINVSPSGKFSASLKVHDFRLPLKGKFDAVTGDFTHTIPANKHHADVNITLHQGANNLTGSVSTGSLNVAFTARDAGLFTKAVPAPAGAYKTLVKALTTDAGFPQADGVGTLTIAKLGAVRFAAKLADGTPFTCGGAVLTDDLIYLYSSLYHGGGFFTGQFVIALQDDSDLHGLFDWLRPAPASGVAGPPAIYGSVELLANRYIAPFRTTSGLFKTKYELLRLKGGSPALDTTIRFSVEPNDHLVIDSAFNNSLNIIVSINRASGTFSGSFVRQFSSFAGSGTPRGPDPKKATKFGGVLFQRQDYGSGFFLEGITSGSATLNPGN